MKKPTLKDLLSVVERYRKDYIDEYYKKVELHRFFDSFFDKKRWFIHLCYNLFFHKKY